ncbi:MAG: SHOCT domain-containing protein [Mycobacteriales bacterium]
MTSQDDLTLLKRMYQRGEISDEQYDVLRRHVLWGTPLPQLIGEVPAPPVPPAPRTLPHADTPAARAGSERAGPPTGALAAPGRGGRVRDRGAPTYPEESGPGWSARRRAGEAYLPVRAEDGSAGPGGRSSPAYPAEEPTADEPARSRSRRREPTREAPPAP